MSERIIGMPEYQYHSGTHLGIHNLRDFARNPRRWLTHQRRLRETTPAMEFGRAFHCAILEPERFAATYVERPDVDGRTKEGKAVLSGLAGKALLTPDDWQRIMDMRDAVHELPEFAAWEIGSRPGGAEVTYRDTWLGVPVQCRVDYEPDPDTLVDIKTCDDLDWFSRDAYKYGYLHQAAWYRSMTWANRFLIIAVEKKDLRVGLFEVQPPIAIQEENMANLASFAAASAGTAPYSTPIVRGVIS